MNNDLIVITFDDEDEAEKVLVALQAMRKKRILSLDDTVIVTKSIKGQVKLHQTLDLTPGTEGLSSSVLGLFAALVFGNSAGGTIWGFNVDQAITVLKGMGVDDKLLTEIEHSMGNHSSAIFFHVKKDSMSDPDEVVKVLAQFKGRIHQTTLPIEAETYVMKLLEGRANLV